MRIDKAIAVRRDSLRSLATRFGVHHDALRRHREAGHVQKQPSPHPFEKGNVHRFQPGNLLSKGNVGNLAHGGRATVIHQPRAQAIAESLRPHVPGYQDGDEPVLALLGLALARCDAMAGYLDGYEGIDEPEGTTRLRQELNQQMRNAAKFAAELGLTPTSRANIVGNVATATAIREHLRDRYGSA